MWQLRKTNVILEALLMEESLFTVGNGYLGVRGCFEEGYGDMALPTIRGSYINGLYEQIPIVYGESAFGFPRIQDKQPRIMDTQTCEVYLDGEKANLFKDKHTEYLRVLDYRKGTLTRTYKYQTKSGKIAQLTFKRLASLPYKNLLAYSIDVIYEGHIELCSVVDTNVINAHDENDPRVSSYRNRLMGTTEVTLEDDVLTCGMQTHTTLIDVFASTMHFSNEAPLYLLDDEKGSCIIAGENHVQLSKYCVLTDSLRTANPREFGLVQLQEIKENSFDQLTTLQQNYLDHYWHISDIEIKGQNAIQASIRFMLFQLLQSVGTDHYANVSAKGLSGEGYEGQYFWDTEIYITPALQVNQPEMARNLLEYRYRILPLARERALELGHKKGAAYPWRTISGIECSGYFPAGTAQYHINADIAYSFIQYYLYTEDHAFLLDIGAEVIWETARIWLEIGNKHQGQFMIHNVTGPDEYTAIVNNNYYTNAMAKYHLEWAVKIYKLCESWDEDEKTKSQLLKSRLKLDCDEIEDMAWASENMVLLFDKTLNINPQDDAFLQKPIWPFETTRINQYPLLLHFHPLTIYRYQVLKQADTVLAHYLMEDYTPLQVIKNSFHYYEQLTTHDSSLSACIYGIMASKCGCHEKAYDYFLESVQLDLEDTHKNTKDGLHMANIAGTILSIFSGFTGLRVKESGMSFHPQLPICWESYRYRIQYRGRVIAVEMNERFTLTLLSGEPFNVTINDLVYRLSRQIEVHPIKAVLFDLDGVLTETSHQHFLAWRSLAKELGYDLDDAIKESVKGISRMESLEIVLRELGIEARYSQDEKLELASQKNALYLELISQFDFEHLSPGALDLLEALKNKGIKIGLASASKNAPLLLRKLGIEAFFQAVVDPNEIEMGKPAPDIFLKAAQLLDVEPKYCIGIEDAFAGIESIHSAGMRSIGIGRYDFLTNCDNVFESLKDLDFLK